MASVGSAPAPVYGVVTLDGQQYIERHQLFVADIQVDVPYQQFTGLRLTMPGTANFLLKGLSREVTTPGQLVNQEQFFRFRIVNSEGTTWYFTGGLGILDDFVISPLCFGNGMFPFPLIPPVPIHSTGSLVYEIQDTTRNQATIPNPYPYVIHLGFHGVYLIPVNEGQAPLAFGATRHGTLRTR